MRRTRSGGSGSVFALAELLKLQESGQFPDELVKIEGTQIHRGDARRTSNSRHKGNSMRGTIIIVRTVLLDFVSSSLN